MFNKSKTLIIVYKDEMLANEIKKLVETNDDTSEEAIGTKDGTVKIVSWCEKVWTDNKKAGNIDSKVLLIDKIKGSNKLIPVLDIKFDKFGVKYGWAGNQACIFTDTNEMKDRKIYDQFLQELKELPVPDIIKNANAPKEKKVTQKEETVEAESETNLVVVAEEKKGFLGKAKDSLAAGFHVLGEKFDEWGTGAALLAEDLFRDKKMMKKQMLFYGIIQMYNQDLDLFLNS